MTKKRWLIIAGIVCLTFGISFIFFSQTAQPKRKLHYQGRPAEDWLKDHSLPNKSQDVVEAFDQMGTNGMAYLIECLQTKPSRLTSIYWWFCGKCPAPIVAQLPKARFDEWKIYAAANILRRLPPQRFLGQIKPLFKHPDRYIRYNAFSACTDSMLGWPLDDIFPDLLEASADPDPLIRLVATGGFDKQKTHTNEAAEVSVKLLSDPDGLVQVRAAGVLLTLLVQTNLAVTTLVDCLQHPDKRVQHHAALRLGSFDKTHPKVVAAFLKMLQDPDTSLRLKAAHTIGSYPAAAKDAVPLLNEMASSTNRNEAKAAKRALHTIQLNGTNFKQ